MMIGRAIAWMNGELSEAERAFCAALQRIQDSRGSRGWILSPEISGAKHPID